VTRHRLSRRGNRQLNTVLHIAARTQTRTGGPGRPYYDRKIAEGKGDREALRCLKRQLSNVVYRHLHADRQARAAAVTALPETPQTCSLNFPTSGVGTG